MIGKANYSEKQTESCSKRGPAFSPGGHSCSKRPLCLTRPHGIRWVPKFKLFPASDTSDKGWSRHFCSRTCTCVILSKNLSVFRVRRSPGGLYTVFAVDVSQYLFYLLLGVLCVPSSLLPLSPGQCPLEQFPYFCSHTKARMFLFVWIPVFMDV